MTKPKAAYIPAFIDPPPPPPPMPGVDDPGLLGEWIAFRDDMNDLEASLNVSHPDLDWSEAMQPFKDEADAAIRALTNGSNFHAGKIEPQPQEPAHTGGLR